MAEQAVRALIVDDDEDMQFLIRSTIELANHGLQVVGVAGGVAEGEAMFWALAPDVLIVDYRMADGTGVDLVTQLRGGDAQAEVIFCSAYLSDEIRSAMDDLGACAVLQKDQVSEIPRTIRECLAA